MTARRILLPESEDARIRAAARAVAGDGDVAPVLFGAPRDNEAAAGVEFITPRAEDYATQLRDCYAPKVQLDEEKTRALLAEPAHLAALLLARGEVDGVVAGAATATADVVRAGLRVVKCRRGVETVSGFFIMRPPNRAPMIFADCALVVEPTEAQLLDIAAAAAESADVFLDEPPVIAFLSFSTAGSAAHPLAAKMARVADAFRRRYPQRRALGEIQADAALDAATARKKGVRDAEAANVLIFPDLNAGNIGYKLVQRLSGCVAVGPVLQGLNKPFNDLSRGATVDDIAEMIRLTAKQAAAGG